MANLQSHIKKLFQEIPLFCAEASGLTLRSYQEQVAESIVDSVLTSAGFTFVVIFPRQSGKNELQAQVETYLLALLSTLDAEMVKVSPTWKPQSLNAMRRLERVLSRNLITRIMGWQKEQGYIFRINRARIFFLSGAPTANVVGATASTLLECDEAQDVQISKWDKEIAPMAASTNATRVFWGTAWTSNTLLAREKRAALKAEEQDGIKRVFQIDADTVGAEVPAYKKFVEMEILKHGRNHPFVRTQYFGEEIDSEGGMFPPDRLALMKGGHARRVAPTPDELYAFLIDVAGEDEAEEAGELMNVKRDSTALTIVEIDLSTMNDPLIQAPRYLVRKRQLWTGAKHSNIYGQLIALAELWEPRYLIVDSTGVGAGLTSFLSTSLGAHRVMPFVFTQKSKSDLGWNFLSVVETGRYKEYYPGDSDQDLFWLQCYFARTEVLPGPNRIMRWSVPDGTRDQVTGDLVHDDLIVSSALCSELDNMQWGTAESLVIPGVDPLDEFSEVF